MLKLRQIRSREAVHEVTFVMAAFNSLSNSNSVFIYFIPNIILNTNEIKLTEPRR